MRVHLRRWSNDKSHVTLETTGWVTEVSHRHKQRVYSHLALELKLEEVVGDLGATLTRKHKHFVPAYGYREVAARWRNLTTLIDLMDTKGETLTHTVQCWWALYSQCSSGYCILKFIILASSQHACSRSCRLTVHMSFSLHKGEISVNITYKKQCVNCDKSKKHTWHSHHSQQISTVYHYGPWPHVQTEPLASWNRDKGQ